jgi:hypothetical protein
LEFWLYKIRPFKHETRRGIFPMRRASRSSLTMGIISGPPAVVKALRFAPAIAGGDLATDPDGGKR